MTSVGVTTKSTGTSWGSIGILDSTSWSGWMVLMSGVSSRTRPSSRSRAYSKPAPHAEPCAVAAGRNRATHDDINVVHLARGEQASILQGATQAVDQQTAAAEPLRVEFDKAFFRFEPRNGQVQELAVGQRRPAYRQLGRVGIDLDHPRLAPHRQLLQ